MPDLQFPHVVLPSEFILLLKGNFPATTTSSSIFETLKSSTAMHMVMIKGFKEFDDGRGLEKTINALGWANFRDRLASLYVYKAIHGIFPSKTSMELIDDIKLLEMRFESHGVHSFSRIFLLGLYLRLANLQIQKREKNNYIEIIIPNQIESLLRLSQVRAEKIDWLILILFHFNIALGDKKVMSLISDGKNFNDIYSFLSTDSRQTMMNNLLSYGASIEENDIFLYEKI